MAKKDRPKDSRSDASNRIVYPWREVFLYWSVALLNDGLAHGNSGFFRLGIGQYLLLSKLPVSKCRSSLEAGPRKLTSLTCVCGGGMDPWLSKYRMPCKSQLP